MSDHIEDIIAIDESRAERCIPPYVRRIMVIAEAVCVLPDVRRRMSDKNECVLQFYSGLFDFWHFDDLERPTEKESTPLVEDDAELLAYQRGAVLGDKLSERYNV